VIRCGSKAEAVEWARRCPADDGDVIEVRRIFDPEDFGPEVAASEASLAEKLKRNLDP
jgi:hypothetical protein